MIRITAAILVAIAVACLASRSALHAEEMIRVEGSHPEQADSEVPIGNADPDQPLHMKVMFALRNRAAMERLQREQQDPASPNYRKWLKTGEFDKRYGAIPAQIEAVQKWIESKGFVVIEASPLELEFTGSVAQAERAFSVRIMKFGAAVYANTDDPMIPARFDRVISRIIGLDNMFHLHAGELHSVTPLPAPGPSALEAFPTLPPSMLALSEPVRNVIVNQAESFGPADFRTEYDETSTVNNAGSGGCVAIIGQTDFPDDANTAFNSQFGLPAFTSSNLVRKITGTDPGIIQGSLLTEAEIDIQAVHGAAPGAVIDFYIDSDDFNVYTDPINDNLCGVITSSYGECGASAAEDTSLDVFFQKAAMQGQSYMELTGDFGAAGYVLNMQQNACIAGTSQTLNEFAGSPNVTAVGGTAITPNYDQNGNESGYGTERVWNDPNDGQSSGGASGGGPSAVFMKPSYQQGVTPSDNSRDTPDVAAFASPYFPGAFFGEENNGTSVVNCCEGGTSYSTPLFAALIEVMEQSAGNVRFGLLNPTIYKIASANQAGNGFHDITSGNNSYNGVTGYNAGVGYDLASGWGSIDYAVFSNAFVTNYVATPTTTPTPISAQSPTPTPTVSATGMPSPIPSHTATATISNTPSPTASPIGSTPSPSPTSAGATATPTQSPSVSPTIAPTPQATPVGPKPIKVGGVQNEDGTLVLNFGHLPEGRSKTKNISLTNPNPSPVQIYDVLLNGVAQSVDNICPPTGELLKHKTCKFHLTLTAGTTIGGLATGTLQIDSDALNTPIEIMYSVCVTVKHQKPSC